MSLRPHSPGFGQGTLLVPQARGDNQQVAPEPGPVASQMDALVAVVTEVTNLKMEVGTLKKTLAAQAKRIEELEASGTTSVPPLADSAKHGPDRSDTLKSDNNKPPPSDGESATKLSANQAKASRLASSDAQGVEAMIDAEGHVHRGRDVYCFNESVWDSTLFVGLVEGGLASVDMVLIAMLNFGIQAYFCGLLFNLGLVDSPGAVFKEEMQDFVQWRMGVAHQAENYDPLTNTSLAQRVCQEYGGTIASRSQQNDFERYHEYLDLKTNKSSYFQGPGLLMLALALWMALILKEIISVVGFARMLAAVYGPKTEIIKHEEDGSIELLSMSRGRTIAMFICVALPRFGIAGFLGFVGTYYLGQTFSVEEIILNAMALGFVLEIDELLFCFAPSAARYVVSNLQNVPIESEADMEDDKEHPGSCRSLGRALVERSRVLLVILIVAVFVARFTLIQEVEENMKLAQTILCDGNLSFVFKQNPATNVVHIAAVEDIDRKRQLELDPEELGNVFESVLQTSGLCEMFHDSNLVFKDIIDKLDLCGEDEPQLWCGKCEELLATPDVIHGFATDYETTVSLVTMTTDEVLNGMDCVDLYTNISQHNIGIPFQEQLAALNFTGTISICSEMKEYCRHDEWSIRNVVRKFCPISCNCDHALAQTLENEEWFFDRGGCVPACADLVKAEIDAFEQELLLSPSECFDRDAGLPREEWLPLVQEVEFYLGIFGKLEVMPDGKLQPSEDVRQLFQRYTENDYSDFTETVLHTSNAVEMGGCQFDQDAGVDLVAWAEQTGGRLCKWAKIVAYAFELDICSVSILDRALTPALGLCPVTCGLGVCAGDEYQEDIIGTRRSAWYNVLSYWGEEELYNITCDSSNFFCVKVDKFQHNTALNWQGHMLEVFETLPGENETTLYSAGSTDGLAWALDLFCTMRIDTSRRLTSSNTSNNSGVADQPPCWRIAATQPTGQYPGSAIRWRLRDMRDNIFVTAGWWREKSFCSNYDWRKPFGVMCRAGDSVAVLDHWAGINTYYNELYGTDESRPYLSGALAGMFSIRKAGILGGYDPNAHTIEVTYFGSNLGPQTVDIHMLGYPVGYSASQSVVTGPGQDFQDFVPCLESPSLFRSPEVQTAAVCTGNDALTCTNLVSGISCQSTLEMVTLGLSMVGACEESNSSIDLTARFDSVCGEHCAIQADPDICPFRLFNQPTYAQYYSFTDPHCLETVCECLSPWQILQQEHWECWPEFFSLEPFQPVQVEVQANPNVVTDPVYMLQYNATIANVTRLLERNTACFRKSEGIWEDRTPVEPDGPWCFVKPECLGAFQHSAGASYWPGAQTGCFWRAAYEEECDIRWTQSWEGVAVPAEYQRATWVAQDVIDSITTTSRAAGTTVP